MYYVVQYPGTGSILLYRYSICRTGAPYTYSIPIALGVGFGPIAPPQKKTLGVLFKWYVPVKSNSSLRSTDFPPEDRVLPSVAFPFEIGPVMFACCRAGRRCGRAKN